MTRGWSGDPPDPIDYSVTAGVYSLSVDNAAAGLLRRRLLSLVPCATLSVDAFNHRRALRLFTSTKLTWQQLGTRIDSTPLGWAAVNPDVPMDVRSFERLSEAREAVERALARILVSPPSVCGPAATAARLARLSSSAKENDTDRK